MFLVNIYEMGSCISTCRPKKNFTRERDCVEDKLLIPQAAPTRTPKVAPILVSNKISPCPSSSTPSSSSSNSSLTGTRSKNTTSIAISSCSSSSTSSSSVLSSKGRSFSNEFLLSCLKENPQILRINSIRKSVFSSSTKIDYQKLNALVKSLVEQSIPEKGNLSIPQKRARTSSPSTLSRQKNFFKDSSSSLLPTRTLSSPYLGRRFYGQGLNRDSFRGFASALKEESLRHPSRIHNSNPLGTPLTNRETRIHRISTNIDETSVGEALTHLDNDSIPSDDVDNPLISLDCFIFV